MIYPMYEGKETCERCHRPVEKDKAVWLELNCYTGKYAEPGTIPEEESQGGFAFGPDCVKAVRKAGGNLEFVGLARRNYG